MRYVENPQRQLGQDDILEVELDLKSRDDVPALLLGLQHLYRTRREELFELLNARILPDSDRTVGRPGMDLWRVLALGVVKQGLGCDWDFLRELANEHQTLRAMLGHGWADRERYERQNLIDNVSLMTPELLAEVSRMLVSSGHAVARKKPGAALRGRADSFVVKTDVRPPTDVGLLWDATRLALRRSVAAASAFGRGGWRQAEHLGRGLRRRFQAVRKSGKRTPERVREYLKFCRVLREKAAALEAELPGSAERARRSIREARELAEKLADQVERRLLKGEAIPHWEKIFSAFEPYTRWISKGKLKAPVEFGVPVCVLEDQHRFLLHHVVMWEEEDTHVAVRLIEEARQWYPELTACSFDRGFHNSENRARLDDMLELNALPKKGYRNAAERARETAPEFAEARRQHSAVESAIHHLGHCGLDRVRAHGRDGFARSVALSVVAANCKRLGRLLRDQERARLRRASRRRERKRLRLAA